MAMPRWLLIHGLGATGAVWHGVATILRAHGHTVYCPDLAGHGEGIRLASYSVPALAQHVAEAVPSNESLHVLGHSLGGYVALELASGRYGLTVATATVIGTKLHFTADERQAMTEWARRPVRSFASRTEALARYRRVAGLERATVDDDPHLQRGVRDTDGAWTLAADPMSYLLEAPPFSALLAAALCRVQAACGTNDAMVTLAALQALVPDASAFSGLGHNAHVESPERVAAFAITALSAG